MIDQPRIFIEEVVICSKFITLTLFRNQNMLFMELSI